MQSAFFETPIDNAPIVKLNNGNECIPQHYLVYQHTLESVQRIVLAIEFDTRYPIFVCQENDQIIIQVGIIGQDNYKSNQRYQNEEATNTASKIVYGRKWRVEKELPTSEVIQTVFLALKIAREHEIRELFRLQQNVKTTTPFNNHHDLPLMSNNADLLQKHNKNDDISTQEKIINALSTISYDGVSFSFEELFKKRDNLWFLDLKIHTSDEPSLPELEDGLLINLRLSSLSYNELCFALMEELLNLSNTFVSEHFTYKGFARFSKDICVTSIAQLSSTTRDNQGLEQAMHSSISQMNYAIDKTRVPKLDNSLLSQKIKHTLASFGELSGLPPQTID